MKFFTSLFLLIGLGIHAQKVNIVLHSSECMSCRDYNKSVYAFIKESCITNVSIDVQGVSNKNKVAYLNEDCDGDPFILGLLDTTLIRRNNYKEKITVNKSKLFVYDSLNKLQDYYLQDFSKNIKLISPHFKHKIQKIISSKMLNDIPYNLSKISSINYFDSAFILIDDNNAVGYSLNAATEKFTKIEIPDTIHFINSKLKFEKKAIKSYLNSSAIFEKKLYVWYTIEEKKKITNTTYHDVILVYQSGLKVIKAYYIHDKSLPKNLIFRTDGFEVLEENKFIVKFNVNDPVKINKNTPYYNAVFIDMKDSINSNVLKLLDTRLNDCHQKDSIQGYANDWGKVVKYENNEAYYLERYFPYIKINNSSTFTFLNALCEGRCEDVKWLGVSKYALKNAIKINTNKLLVLYYIDLNGRYGAYLDLENNSVIQYLKFPNINLKSSYPVNGVLHSFNIVDGNLSYNTVVLPN